MNKKQIRHVLISHVPFPILIGLMGWISFTSGSLWFLIPIQLAFPFNYLFMGLCFAYVGTHIGRVYLDLFSKPPEPVWNPKVEAEKERLKGV